MGGSGLFGIVVSSVSVREGEKGLALLVVGWGDRIRLNLADGTGGHADCDVDLDGATPSHRDGNDDAPGWGNRLERVWKSELGVLMALQMVRRAEQMMRRV